MSLRESKCIIDQDGNGEGEEEEKEHEEEEEHHDNMSLLYQSAEMKKIKPSNGDRDREKRNEFVYICRQR